MIKQSPLPTGYLRTADCQGVEAFTLYDRNSVFLRVLACLRMRQYDRAAREDITTYMKRHYVNLYITSWSTGGVSGGGG